MPPVNRPAGDYLAQTLREMQSQINGLSTQQNSVVTDQAGNVRIKTGLQTDGTYGTWYFDASGVLQAKLGDLGGLGFGIAVNVGGTMTKVT